MRTCWSKHLNRLPLRFEINFRASVAAPRLLIALIIHFVISHPNPFANASTNESAQGSIFEALGRKQQWLRLLHYGRNEFLQLSSRVDNSEFFLSHNGAKDPAAELEATFHAFEAESRGKPLEIGPLKLSASCAFPARRKYIEQNFKVKFSSAACTEYLEWKTGLAAKSVSMVFSSSFPGSPGSMFGHTLLKFGRVPTSQLAGQEQFQSSELLDYSLSFAAFTGNANPLKYFAYGIFGGFPGEFGLSPFYLKVREYNHAEGRDLWIYDLNFSEEETELLLDHLWELMNLAQFNYFFFDENCASMLIELIEVAKPDWQLSDKFTYAVLPSDTLKALAQQEGAVLNVRSRAALFQEFKANLMNLSFQERSQFDASVESMHVASSLSRKVLLTLVSYAEWTRMKSKGELAEPLEKLKKASLVALSKLPPKLALNTEPGTLEAHSQASPSSMPQSLNIGAVEDPAQGHSSSKFLIAMLLHGRGGASMAATDHATTKFQRLGSGQELKIGYRYGFHNLMDPPFGYEHGLGIEYLKFAIHVYENSVYLAELTPVSIESINHFTLLSRDLSHSVKFSYLNDSFRTERVEAESGIGIARRGRLFGSPESKSDLSFESTVYALCMGHVSYAFMQSTKDAEATPAARENRQMTAPFGLSADLGLAAGYYQSFGWNGRFHLEAVPFIVRGWKARMRLQFAPFFRPARTLRAQTARVAAESKLALHAEVETGKPWRSDRVEPVTNIEFGTSYFF